MPLTRRCRPRSNGALTPRVYRHYSPTYASTRLRYTTIQSRRAGPRLDGGCTPIALPRRDPNPKTSRHKTKPTLAAKMVEHEAQLAMAEAKHLPKAETQRGRKPKNKQQRDGRAGTQSNRQCRSTRRDNSKGEKLTKVWERLLLRRCKHARQNLVSCSSPSHPDLTHS